MSIDLNHLSDRDLLMRLVVTVENMGVDMGEMKDHQEVQNGDVSAIKSDQLFQRGALAMLSFLVIAGIPIAGIIAAVWL